jgi:hypothetical protein
VAHFRDAPTSSASTSIAVRVVPSSPVHEDRRSLPVTTTRQPPVGDVLVWVGPWQADRPTRGAWQGKQVPVWVLCCPNRDYLVSTSRAFDQLDSEPATASPEGEPRPVSHQRIPRVLTRRDIDARNKTTRR